MFFKTNLIINVKVMYKGFVFFFFGNGVLMHHNEDIHSNYFDTYFFTAKELTKECFIKK